MTPPQSPESESGGLNSRAELSGDRNMGVNAPAVPNASPKTPFQPPSHDPYAALRIPAYRRFFLGNYISVTGMQMQATAVGWDIYQRTHSELALGIVGLVQFLPVVLLWLLAGHAADHGNRKWIVGWCMIVVALASSALIAISLFQLDYRWMYVALAAVGAARAFQQPAKAALMPMLVPVEHFGNAVTWNSSGFQIASVLGPGLAGWLIATIASPRIVYLLDAVGALIFLWLLLPIHVPRPAAQQQREAPPHVGRSRDLIGGLRYLIRQPVVFGAIALDMFAVLLGGAVTLLPVYAEQILQVGASGLGWLRAAPAIGALVMALVIAHRPPIRRAGWALMFAVVGFGITTIVFGLSHNFLLSWSMLCLGGAFDNISVVIRHTLVQTQTPDALRGRVSAVNGLFIGASNELGGFESGIVAHWFGPIFSVVSGGVGTILVVAVMTLCVPQLRDYTETHSSDPQP